MHTPDYQYRHDDFAIRYFGRHTTTAVTLSHSASPPSLIATAGWLLIWELFDNAFKYSHWWLMLFMPFARNYASRWIRVAFKVLDAHTTLLNELPPFALRWSPSRQPAWCFSRLWWAAHLFILYALIIKLHSFSRQFPTNVKIRRSRKFFDFYYDIAIHAFDWLDKRADYRRVWPSHPKLPRLADFETPDARAGDYHYYFAFSLFRLFADEGESRISFHLFDWVPLRRLPHYADVLKIEFYKMMMRHYTPSLLRQLLTTSSTALVCNFMKAVRFDLWLRLHFYLSMDFRVSQNCTTRFNRLFAMIA